MATKQIKAFSAVVTPATDDKLLVQQTLDDVTRYMTPAQILGLLATVTQAEAEAGTATTRRIWTAARVNQAIAALTAAEVSLSTVTQAEAEAGTGTTRRIWTALRVAQAVAALAAMPRSYLAGLGLANNSGDATNDIDIAVGACRDSTNAANLALASALTKRLDAAWAVGTGNGGLDTGAIANATYHVWLIKRSDTGVVDALFSTSASAPNMPTSYDYKRRIGSIVRTGAAIKAFVQNGDEFQWTAGATADWSTNNPGTAAITETLTVPTGISVRAKVRVSIETASGVNYGLLSDLATTDVAPTLATANFGIAVNATGVGNSTFSVAELLVRTSTAAQIRCRYSATDGSTDVTGGAAGWFDRRGQDD